MPMNTLNVMLCVAIFLGGCAVDQGGSEFSSRAPDDHLNASTREVYYASNGTDRVTTRDLAAEVVAGPMEGIGGYLNAEGPVLSVSEAREHGILRDVVANSTRGHPQFDPATFGPRGEMVPVLAQQRVLRIWVSAYRDRDGDLRAPGYVFVDLRDAPFAGVPAVAGGSTPIPVSQNHLQSVEMIEGENAPTVAVRSESRVSVVPVRSTAPN